ncbi:MAG TPA: PEP-CTERM sorting domain-containing protein [Terriglobales bacterium]|nr:PEP-CTERM sorting domain-containing protein [Terriglobales bacterium]
MKRVRVITLLVTLAVLAMGAQAVADDFTLNVPSSALVNKGTNGTNTFGTVSVTLSGGVMHVVFTLDPNYYVKTNTSGQGSAGFQVTGAGFALSNITGTDSEGNTLTPLAATISTSTIPVPGAIGSYNVLIDLGTPMTKCNKNGCTTTTSAVQPGLRTLSFDVTGVTALDPAMFFAHVVAPGITGYVGTSTNSIPTPEPASLFLMGTGLLGFGRMARNRFRK